MTSLAADISCVLCAQPATQTVEPPHRTLARGADPSDESYTITVILPDVSLCAEHALDIREGKRLVGWCDDQRCRIYGELGVVSACGAPYTPLISKRRS